MATNHTRTDGYRGLLIPDPRLTPDTWDGSASFQEAGPRPGQAIPGSSSTETVVRTSGLQDTTTYALTCLRGGYNDGGEFGWAPSVSGTLGPMRGCDAPNLALDLRNIGGGITTATAAGAMESIKTSSGRVVWLFCKVIAIGSVRKVYASYSDDMVTIEGADDEIRLLSEDNGDDEFYGYTLDDNDCVCGRWDDERQVVQCWIRVVDPINSATQFVLFESADEAETWTLVQRNCLNVPYEATNALRKPVVGVVAGAVLLLQPEDNATATYALPQFISRDRGRSFDLLRADSSDYYGFTMVEFNGKLILAGLNWTDDDTYVLSLGSAYESIQTAAWEQVTNTTDSGAIALAVQHGRLYLYSVPVAFYQISVRTSLTGAGDAWDQIGHEVLTFEGAGSNVELQNLSAVGAFGGVVLAFQAGDTGVGTAFRNHLFALRCGGWRTITMPRVSPAGDTNREARAAFGASSSTVAGTFYAADRTTWYPFLAPDGITGPIWTTAGAGTESGALAAGGSPYRLVSCTSGQAKYWSQDFDETLSKGIMIYFDLEMDAGGSVSATDSAVQVVLSDGTTEYNVVIRLSTADGVYFLDGTSGTATLIQADIVNRHAFVLAMRETTAGSLASASVYSVGYGALDDVSNWERLHTPFSVTADTSSPAANSSVAFGVLTTSSGVAVTQRWYAVHFLAVAGMEAVYDPAVRDIVGQAGFLGGAPMSATPSELRDGFCLSFTGGPAKTDETWTVAPKYDYAKEHVYPHLYPSPRQVWRNTADNRSETFQWLFNAEAAPEGFGSSVWGVALIGANFAEWKLQGQNNSGTWIDILDVDLSTEFSGLNYRAGAISVDTAPYVTVNSSGSAVASRFIHENELAGGSISLAGQVFKIIRNASGFWNTQVGKKPVLFLSGWDPSVASSGTLDIWPPNVVVTKAGLGSTEYRRIRFVIASQTTADGHYEIGELVIGPVAVFGKQYSMGRVLGRQANVGVFTTNGGVNNAVRNGPTSRTMEFGWFEGIDQTDLYEAVGLTTEPDYVTLGDTASIASVVAARFDTATMLDGLFGLIDGPLKPVVVINSLTHSASAGAQRSLTVPDSFLYGRTQGNLTRTTVRGTENADEVVQVAAITVKEDV